MLSFDVNWLAVVVAAIAPMIIGFLWYGPLFGKYWMGLIGRTEEDLRGGASTGYVVAIVASLVTSLAIAVLLEFPDQVDWLVGVTFGLFAAVGFVVTTQATNSAFAGPPWRVTMLFVGYQLVSFAVMGAILGAWR